MCFDVNRSGLDSVFFRVAEYLQLVETSLNRQGEPCQYALRILLVLLVVAVAVDVYHLAVHPALA